MAWNQVISLKPWNQEISPKPRNQRTKPTRIKKEVNERKKWGKPSYTDKINNTLKFSAAQYYKECTKMRKAELEMACIEHEAKMEAFEKEEQRKQALFDQNRKIENVKLRCHNLEDNLLKKRLSSFSGQGW